MTVCNQGIVLGQTATKIARWCHLPVGHKGEHETIWQLKPFRWTTGDGK